MNFIVFSDDWGRHPSSCEHLFRELLAEHKIIWVNTIGYRRPQFSYYDIKRTYEKMLSWFTIRRHILDAHELGNLIILSPVIIPYNNIHFVRRFNRFTVKWAVRKAATKLGIGEYILFGSLPVVGEFYKDYPNSLKVYYCVDDFAQFPGVDERLVTRMENELIELSDIILYTAKYLEKKFAVCKNKAHYFPHGVGSDHFSRVSKGDYRPQNERPVIGFFGYLSQWIDVDLILSIADARPDWDIKLIGGTDQNIDALTHHRNIALTGPVNYSLLPTLASGFDVGIIPFKINDLTKAVNPLKFLEYMALGIPVVSTPLPELVRFGSNVYLADNYSEFIEMIERALAENNADRRWQRIQLAHENSWASKATQLLNIIKATDNRNLVHMNRECS